MMPQRQAPAYSAVPSPPSGKRPPVILRPGPSHPSYRICLPPTSLSTLIGTKGGYKALEFFLEVTKGMPQA